MSTIDNSAYDMLRRVTKDVSGVQIVFARARDTDDSDFVIVAGPPIDDEAMPHAMRGLAAKLASDDGILGEVRAGGMGHEDVSTTTSCAKKEAVAEGSGRSVSRFSQREAPLGAGDTRSPDNGRCGTIHPLPASNTPKPGILPGGYDMAATDPVLHCQE